MNKNWNFSHFKNIDYVNGGSIFESITEKNPESRFPILAVTQDLGAVPRDLIKQKIIVSDKSIKSYKIVRKGDFIISLRSFQGGIEYSNYDGLCSPAYIILRAKNRINKDYYKYYFKTHNYIQNLNKKLEGIRDGKMISYKNFSEVKIPFPSLDLQNKVVSILESVDDKINLLTKKKELLEQYKTGVMQKIFSKEISFKDDNGNDFPDWDNSVLDDLGTTYSGLSGKTSNDFGKGKPFIQYMQVYSSKIHSKEFELVKINEGEKQNIAQRGDIFFTVSSEGPSDIGMSAVLTKDEGEVYLNSFCFGFRPNSLNTLSPEFSSYLFRSPSVRKEIVKLAQGSTRFNMSKTQFLKIKIEFPSLEEQEKIAKFLSSLDKKIDLVSSQIDKTKEFKKGLLQQMFV